MEQSRRVGITSSLPVTKIADLLPSNEGRQSIVYWLIKSYGMLKNMKIIPIRKTSKADLESFHSKEFVEVVLKSRDELDETADDYEELKKLRNISIYADNRELVEDIIPILKVYTSKDHDFDSSKDNIENFGLLDDCYIFPFMNEYISVVAGSTIETAKYLILEHKKGHLSIGINWYGGRHHASKGKASGFCYVNDIVLGINTLRTYFPKVFYLDLDLHHGDGVERAYKYSNKVLTCSVHLFDPGFYPGTGGHSDKKAINIPTKRGLSDSSLLFIVENIIIPIMKNFQPSAVVFQLGADGLATDKLKEWNLSIKGFTSIVKKLVHEFEITQDGVKIKPPMMILGGGGYNHLDTARLWTNITQMIIHPDLELKDDIPNSPILEEFYDDGYKFWNNSNLNPRKITDENINDLEELKSKVLSEYGII